MRSAPIDAAGNMGRLTSPRVQVLRGWLAGGMCPRIGECDGYATSSIRTVSRQVTESASPLRPQPLRAPEEISELTRRSRRTSRPTITYHSYIHDLAMSAAGEAMTLGLALSHYVADRRSSGERDDSKEVLERLRSRAAALRQAIDKLLMALPPEADIDSRKLEDHLSWIEYWLKMNSPISCAHDPNDIVGSDLPGVLKQFDKWYASQSVLDDKLNARLLPHISSGQLNSAVREAWPIFKTRMVERFGVSEEIDGHKLVQSIFGSNGATAGLLDNKEREGYLNLFKGLYALSRNPLSHNDISPNPAEVDATLLLISTALSKVEQLTTEDRHAKEGLRDTP